MSIIKRCCLIFATAVFSLISFSYAQVAVPRSEITETIDGKEYYIHMVRQGQTLEAIAETYQVSSREINEANPALKGNINTGSIIRIPKQTTEARQAGISSSIPERIQESRSEGNTHTVAARETFFGIARIYNITVAELRAANPGIESLQPGQTLIIPQQEKQQQQQEIPSYVPQETHLQQPQPETKQGVYTVQTGETLFSLSRRFGLSVEELIDLNPELRDGLKAGQSIIVRKPEETKPDYQIITRQDTIVSYNYHRVRRGETLYSLGKKYGLSVEELLKHNPHVAEGLQPRQVMQIPVYEIKTRRVVHELIPVEPVETPYDTVKDVFIPEDCIPLTYDGKKFNIALMLPFFLDSQLAETSPTDTLNPLPPPNPNRIYDFMQFYYGAMMAVDSLRNKGLNANLFVYDVDNTPQSLERVMKKPELPSMDLIIGPLFAGNFDLMARFAREHKISIVNPLSVRSEFLISNPNVVKAQPTTREQVNLIAGFISERFSDHNIIVVRQYSFSENDALAVFRNELANFTLNDVIYIRDSLNGIIRYLDNERPNVVIGLSNDKVFSIELVRKLNDIRADFNITCFGMQEWEDFALDTDHIVNLRLHLPSYSFIDYNSEGVKRFIASFRIRYGVEPLPHRFAFAAFDVTYYFINALMKYGNTFQACLPYYKHRGLQLPFEFAPQQWHGLENKGLCIYRVDNFKQVEVYPR